MNILKDLKKEHRTLICLILLVILVLFMFVNLVNYHRYNSNYKSQIHSMEIYINDMAKYKKLKRIYNERKYLFSHSSLAGIKHEIKNKIRRYKLKPSLKSTQYIMVSEGEYYDVYNISMKFRKVPSNKIFRYIQDISAVSSGYQAENITLSPHRNGWDADFIIYAGVRGANEDVNNKKLSP